MNLKEIFFSDELKDSDSEYSSSNDSDNDHGANRMCTNCASKYNQ